MARITPKLNWISSDVPAPSDFNRIENNNKQAFDEIDANEAQRDIDEAALQANIDAEESRAILADVVSRTFNGLGSHAMLICNDTSATMPGTVFLASTLKKSPFSEYGEDLSGQWTSLQYRYMGQGTDGYTLFVRTL